jgi:hypothetical protein
MSGTRRRPHPTRRALLVMMGVLLATGATVVAPAVAGAKAPPTRPLSATGIARWHKIGSYTQNTLMAGEGVATVTGRGHGSRELYRGLLTIPKNLAAQGWGHIGDPDAANGDVFDDFQGPGSGHTKMFLVTKPSGATEEYTHTLVRGELYNNSFVAISPDSQWMIAGEWETMTHFQIYPTPLLNHKTSAHGGALRLSGYIKLDHKVNDIQGCDFTSKTVLICASDDDTQTLFSNQKPLLEVDLRRALGPGSVTGHVIDLGSIPQTSTCTGTFEAEGVDYDVAKRILRVEIIQPAACILKTTIDEYAPKR